MNIVFLLVGCVLGFGGAYLWLSARAKSAEKQASAADEAQQALQQARQENAAHGNGEQAV